MNCVDTKRPFNVLIRLSMPTVLAAVLLAFMRVFTGFDIPSLIGEGYRIFPAETYSQYLGRTG